VDGAVDIIDQTRLPHRLEILRLASLEDAARAISDMHVRGAPLIGATAAWGIALAMREDASDAGLQAAAKRLRATRPTAVNLFWAVRRCGEALRSLPSSFRVEAAAALARAICDEDVALNAAIGDHGLAILRSAAMKKRGGEPLNILTHCNAGWLATVDWGTATAPIYKAHDAGVPIHVFVDETRPRNQGASLTMWELMNHGVPCTLIVDNAGGHLMRQGRVDICIVGTDRVAANGDVCNKIGTYLKALAAKDNGIPFYVAAPSPSIDFSIASGDEVRIEERSPMEVTHLAGEVADGEITQVCLTLQGARAANPAFDVTPSRLVSGLVTERGILPADEDALAEAFPDAAADALARDEAPAS
jgi:methylthioribose-1-phosphate isomerase